MTLSRSLIVVRKLVLNISLKINSTSLFTFFPPVFCKHLILKNFQIYSKVQRMVQWTLIDYSQVSHFMYIHTMLTISFMLNPLKINDGCLFFFFKKRKWPNLITLYAWVNVGCLATSLLNTLFLLRKRAFY